MDKKKGFNINWLQIIVTAILTGLVSLTVAVLVFNYTTEKVELIYEEFPVSSFESNDTKVSILNYSIKNVGKKRATEVEFFIEIDSNSLIVEPNINLSNSLTKFNFVHNALNSITYRIKTLYEGESCNISLLVENLEEVNYPKIELRSAETIGSKFVEKKESISPSVIYMILTVSIIILILFIVLVLSGRKIIQVIKGYSEIIEKESQLEIDRASDIILEGVEYCDMGLIDESIRVLSRGKYFYPEWSSIHANLARAFAKKGDNKSAEIQFRIAEKLIKSESDSLIYNYTRAHYCALLKNKSEALQFLRKAMEFDRERVLSKMVLDVEFQEYYDDEDFLKLKE